MAKIQSRALQAFLSGNAPAGSINDTHQDVGIDMASRMPFSLLPAAIAHRLMAINALDSAISQSVFQYTACLPLSSFHPRDRLLNAAADALPKTCPIHPRPLPALQGVWDRGHVLQKPSVSPVRLDFFGGRDRKREVLFRNSSVVPRR